jgi:hypothetical protein
VVTVSGATGTRTFAGNFMLVAAINPCPCGYYGDPAKECACSAMMIHCYRKPTGDCAGGSSTAAWHGGDCLKWPAMRLVRSVPLPPELNCGLQPLCP